MKSYFVNSHLLSLFINHYRIAANTASRFHSHRVLPCRAQRLRSAPSNLSSFKRRLANDLRSFIILSGLTSASTTTWT